MVMGFYKVYCVAILCLAVASLAHCAFSPSKAEEDVIANCLLRGKHNKLGKCGRLIRPASRMHERQKRGVSTNNPNDNAAEDYMCALNDYQNTEGTRLDVLKAVESAGTCGHLYKSIWKTWRNFLVERRYATIMFSPTLQHRNGTMVTAFFNSTGNYGAKYSPQDVKAADIVISRSPNEGVEYFGKYLVTASSHLDDEQSDRLIHKSLQAACPSNHRRYFVGGLNEFGLRDVSTWLTAGDKSVTIDVESIPQRQILRAPNGTYVEEEIDLTDSVSAIVLHVRHPVKKQILQLLGRSNADPMAASQQRVERDLAASALRRLKRSRASGNSVNGNCHRAKYIRAFSENKLVLRPEYFDLGECVGSCEEIVSRAELNATNHAITMKTEERWGRTNRQNPEPTVCCIPISYRDFHYITLDERGNITGTYVENMVTDYCGCR